MVAIGPSRAPSWKQILAIDDEARAAVLAVHAIPSGRPLAAKGLRDGPTSPVHRAASEPALLLDPEASAEWEERAATLEFDGGFNRSDADRRASLHVLAGR